MKTYAALLSILVALGCGSAFGQCKLDVPAEVHNGFLQGQDLVDYSDQDLGLYVMGYVNGIFLAPLMDAPKPCVRKAEGCVEGMSSIQLIAIMRKYLEDNPETWHEGAHILTYRALFGRCMFRR